MLKFTPLNNLDLNLAEKLTGIEMFDIFPWVDYPPKKK
jgi:hypothetical protein